MSGTTRVSRYKEGKTNLDFTEARDSEWQWHQLGTCKSAPRSRQVTMPTPHHSSFLQAGCPSCRPTNSVKALKAQKIIKKINQHTSTKQNFFGRTKNYKLHNLTLLTVVWCKRAMYSNTHNVVFLQQGCHTG